MIVDFECKICSTIYRLEHYLCGTCTKCKYSFTGNVSSNKQSKGSLCLMQEDKTYKILAKDVFFDEAIRIFLKLKVFS